MKKPKKKKTTYKKPNKLQKTAKKMTQTCKQMKNRKQHPSRPRNERPTLLKKTDKTSFTDGCRELDTSTAALAFDLMTSSRRISDTCDQNSTLISMQSEKNMNGYANYLGKNSASCIRPSNNNSWPHILEDNLLPTKSPASKTAALQQDTKIVGTSDFGSRNTGSLKMKTIRSLC